MCVPRVTPPPHPRTRQVLNELEHSLSPELYTLLYDAIVQGIQRWCPTASPKLKFMGLALGGVDIRYISYFLNKSHHKAGVPIDAISFHHVSASWRGRRRPCDARSRGVAKKKTAPPPTAQAATRRLVAPPPVQYAGANARDGGAGGADEEGFCPSGDDFVHAIVQVQAARAASDGPNVLMDADEVGVILPDDNDAKYTSLQPGCVGHVN